MVYWWIWTDPPAYTTDVYVIIFTHLYCANFHNPVLAHLSHINLSTLILCQSTCTFCFVASSLCYMSDCRSFAIGFCGVRNRVWFYLDTSYHFIPRWDSHNGQSFPLTMPAAVVESVHFSYLYVICVKCAGMYYYKDRSQCTITESFCIHLCELFRAFYMCCCYTL